MTLKERIIHFFIEIKNLYSLIVWIFCIPLNVYLFAGFRIFSGLIKSQFTDVRYCVLYEKNTHYGKPIFEVHTQKKQNDVYNSYGDRIGYIETNGSKTVNVSVDNTRNHTNYGLFFLYFVIFPLLRVLAVLNSFLAIFLKHFFDYTSVPTESMNSPKMKTEKRKILFTWLNILIVVKK